MHISERRSGAQTRMPNAPSALPKQRLGGTAGGADTDQRDQAESIPRH